MRGERRDKEGHNHLEAELGREDDREVQVEHLEPRGEVRVGREARRVEREADRGEDDQEDDDHVPHLVGTSPRKERRVSPGETQGRGCRGRDRGRDRGQDRGRKGRGREDGQEEGGRRRTLLRETRVQSLRNSELGGNISSE